MLRRDNKPVDLLIVDRGHLLKILNLLEPIIHLVDDILGRSYQTTTQVKVIHFQYLYGSFLHFYINTKEKRIICKFQLGCGMKMCVLKMIIHYSNMKNQNQILNEVAHNRYKDK